MTIRKLLCICLALVLALSLAACTSSSKNSDAVEPVMAPVEENTSDETEDAAEEPAEAANADGELQAQLDAANARIAELEAQVETYYPFYAAQIVATFGDGHIVWLEDAQSEYDAVASQYEAYGMSLEAYGLVDTVKRDILETIVTNAVLFDKAAELGLDQFDDETEAGFEAEAQSSMDEYIDYYIENVYPDAEEPTDAMRDEAASYWDSYGITQETIRKSLRETATLDAVYEYAIKDVEVTEEDIQAAYEAMVANNQEEYRNDRTYNSDRTSGVAIAWNPEGYRAVKHVLIMFDNEQAQRYSDLQAQLVSLEAERDAIENPAEEETGEDAEDLRTLDEVDADIAACNAELDALYAELMPTAEEVIEAFEDGADFNDLIEKYNQDPGMQNEPTATDGYAVAENSTMWEQPFTEGAMAIENIGEISGPVCGANGIHIIYYMADIEPGEVGLEAVRESVTRDAENLKIQSAYDAQVAAWVEEANVEYHYESFGLSAE